MDTNENPSHCERTSDVGKEGIEQKEEEKEDKVRLLVEKMPSTESESSGCSKTALAADPMEDSLTGHQEEGQGDLHSGTAAHACGGEPVKVETEESGEESQEGQGDLHSGAAHGSGGEPLKVETEKSGEDSQEGQGDLHSGAAGHASGGELVKAETEKSGGRTTPDSPSSIYQVTINLVSS